MPRQARLLSESDAWYHLMNRAAGRADFLPFQEPAVRRRLRELIRHYVAAYCCQLAAETVMDNHYHLVLFMPQYRRLSRCQLQRRARRLYGPNFRRYLRTDRDWRRLNRRLFSVSELMRNINGRFAEWFNRRMGRRGPFWADRFKSVWLQDRRALQDCLLYVELNPVRAGLVARPEQWPAGSARQRMAGRDRALVPLTRIFGEDDPERAFLSYRMRLLYRGTQPGREGQARIPDWVLQSERRRGFHQAGLFRRSLRLFTDGVVLGPRCHIETVLEQCQRQGLYRRRRHAVAQLGGLFYTLREQRRRPHRSPRPTH